MTGGSAVLGGKAQRSGCPLDRVGEIEAPELTGNVIGGRRVCGCALGGEADGLGGGSECVVVHDGVAVEKVPVRESSIVVCP